jgi:GntR family transcriptional regulator
MYEQIKEGIKQAIYKGQLKNNDLLPSVRQLAKDLNVSMITTKRAYSDLEEEGFIYTISGKGTFVKIEDLTEIKSTRQKELSQEFEAITIKMKKAEIEKSTLNEIIDKVYGGNDNEQ